MLLSDQRIKLQTQALHIFILILSLQDSYAYVCLKCSCAVP